MQLDGYTLRVSRRITGQSIDLTKLFELQDGDPLWLPARVLPAHLVSVYHEDFLHDVDLAYDWILHQHHTSSQANSDDLCGVVELTSHLHDNDDAYLHSKNKNWKFQTDKRLSFQARVRFAKVGAASFGVGLISVMVGDELDDDGAGPNDSTYDGAHLFVTQTEGTMASVWSFVGSNGSGKTATTTLGIYADNTWDVVGFDYDPGNGTTGILTPYVSHDGGAFTFGTARDIPISGLDDIMYLHIMLKNGSGNAETLGVDYMTVWQER